MVSDRDFMAMHLEALYNHDACGNMLTVNDGGNTIAPRFFLGRTADGILWRFRQDVRGELRDVLERHCLAEPIAPDLAQLPRNASVFNRLLARQSPIQQVWSGPAYRFPERLPEDTRIVPVTGENSDLLRPYFDEWINDVPVCQPFLALVDGEIAVSVCGSVRITQRACEAGVETAPDFRGRGFAALVTAAWAEAVRQLGPIPLYSTSWENTASQSVASKLGLLQYGVDFHVT